jgi:diguanylate cyclase (GGDEF)-like protein
VTSAHAALLPLLAATALACLHAARGAIWRTVWLLLAGTCGLAAAMVAVDLGGGDPQPVGLAASIALMGAAAALFRAIVPGTRRELLFDGTMLGLGIATIWAGFVVVPALDGPWEALTAAVLMAASGGALALAAVCSFGTAGRNAYPAVLRICVAHSILLLCRVAGVGDVGFAVALGLSALVLLSAAAVRPRARTQSDPEDDGADSPMLRHLMAPIACMAVFPASLGVLLAVRGPSTLEVALWGATWSIAGLLIFARQHWLSGDRHRAVVRERELRREMVRRNAELAALTDLAGAVTQMRKERPLVDRALQVLLRVADARSVHIELAGERSCLPPGALPPGEEDDPFALSLPLVVRDEQLGSVTLQSREEPFPAETVRLIGLLADQLAVGVSHIRDYNEKSHQALRDPLTGIYNRRVLLDAMARELLRAARENGEVALTMLDIDDFKAINDVYGHEMGDEVLRRVAACGRDVVRPGDTFARIGGEEFALLTPGTGTREALLIAERLRLAVAALEVVPERGVTVSAGLAAWPADAHDGDTLRRAADEALYRAKAAGKNRCELAGEAPSLA